MSEYLLLLLSTVLVNNVVLVKFLGLCPFMGISKKTDTAISMGLATTFVMTMASAACWILETPGSSRDLASRGSQFYLVGPEAIAISNALICMRWLLPLMLARP